MLVQSVLEVSVVFLAGYNIKVACIKAAVIVGAVAHTIFGVAVIRHWFSMVICLQSIIVIVSGSSRAGKKLKTEKFFGKSVFKLAPII